MDAQRGNSLHCTILHGRKFTHTPKFLGTAEAYFLPCHPNFSDIFDLSGHVPEIQAEVKVVKIKNPYFSCWAWSTPWGHVLSLKSFCRNPVLSWAIRYSVFRKVKSTSSLEFVCDDPFSTFWHLMVKFG